MTPSKALELALADALADEPVAAAELDLELVVARMGATLILEGFTVVRTDRLPQATEAYHGADCPCRSTARIGAVELGVEGAIAELLALRIGAAAAGLER